MLELSNTLSVFHFAIQTPDEKPFLLVGPHCDQEDGIELCVCAHLLVPYRTVSECCVWAHAYMGIGCNDSELQVLSTLKSGVRVHN